MQVDTIFTDARIYNVYLRSWELTDVAVLKGKILFTGDTGSAGLTAGKYIACAGKPLIPGMIDIHLHIESSLCVPMTFAKAVLGHGVTTVVSEPHEIANVFGTAGIEEMIRASTGAAIDIFYGVPSSVPSTTSELETTGGTIGTDDLEYLMRTYPEVICLGEVMNYGSLISNFDAIAAGTQQVKTVELIRAMHSRYPLAAVEGHCPSVRGLDLAKLLYLGIDSDHCMQDVQGMHERFAAGMFVELQEKSITPEIIEYLISHRVEGLYSFVTDDVPPDVLSSTGHLDHIVRKALAAGLSLEQVIIATSHAPAQRMNFHDRGAISPGKIADLILLTDESSAFTIEQVYKNGISAAELPEQPRHRFDSRFTDSLHLPQQITGTRELFEVPVDTKAPEVEVLIMRKDSRHTYTEAVHRRLPAAEGQIQWEGIPDLNLVVVLERYTGEGAFSQGFMDGTAITGGAFCSSYAHDHHNLLIIGDTLNDMQLALQQVISMQGGICVVTGGRVRAELNLPIGGILSEAPMEYLAQQVTEIQQQLAGSGVSHPNPIMSLCTLSLPVSPALKITDKGLIEVRTEQLLPLYTPQI